MYSLNPIRVGAVAAIIAGMFIAGHVIPTMFDGNPGDLDSLADYLTEIFFGAGYAALLILFVAILRLRTEQGDNLYGRLGRPVRALPRTPSPNSPGASMRSWLSSPATRPTPRSRSAST